MKMRLVRFVLGANKRAEAEGIADRIVPIIRSQPGCDGCTFFIDDESGYCGLVVMWASKDAADAAAAVVAPVLGEELEAAGAASVERHLFDVYEPST